MTVTKISVSKNNKDLYQIFLDGSFFCSISGSDLLDTKLVRGQTITSDQINDLLYRSLKGKLTNSALNYLAIRPRSEFEIKQSLKKKLYSHIKETPDYKNLSTEVIIEEIVTSLKAKGLLSDEDFANWLIKGRTASKNPKSRTAIQLELQKKGVPTDISSKYLADLDNDHELEQAKIVAEKKLGLLQKRENEPKQLKIKLTRYLISKGYGWDTVRGIVDSLLKPF